MKRFQKFVAVHSPVHNQFNLEPHLYPRAIFTLNRDAALAEWRGLCAEKKGSTPVILETGSHLSDSTFRYTHPTCTRSNKNGRRQRPSDAKLSKLLKKYSGIKIESSGYASGVGSFFQQFAKQAVGVPLAHSKGLGDQLAVAVVGLQQEHHISISNFVQCRFVVKVQGQAGS